MKLLKLFRLILHREHNAHFKYNKLKIVNSFLDVPEDTNDLIYIVRKGNSNKWVIFKCPNNCGKRIEVNLMKAHSPNWALTIKRGKASLYPSIVVDQCGAHFWLYQNKIKWVV